MRIALLALCLAALVSCELPGKRQPMGDARRASLEKQLSTVTQWEIKGRVGVFNEEESWHANLYWRQAGDMFHIRLIAPIGQKSLDIEGDRHHAVIRDSGGRTARGADIESLVEKQLGWRLPLYSLLYWIKAVPDRTHPIDEFRLSEDGYLEKIKQSGWSAEFRKYRPQGEVVLPVKIFMENEDFKVRVVIREWLL